MLYQHEGGNRTGESSDGRTGIPEPV